MRAIDDLLGVENCATRVSEELFGANEGPSGGSRICLAVEQRLPPLPKKELDLFSEFVARVQ